MKLLLTNPSQPRILHAISIKNCLINDPFHATKILRLYAVNGDLSYARKVFDESPHPTTHLYNAIIRAYARSHEFSHAFLLFTRLLTSQTPPDNYTFACIARACSDRFDAQALRVVHGQIVAFGLELDFICSSAVVSCYCKMGRIADARRAFDRIGSPDLVLYNAMIAGYGSLGGSGKGAELFNAMQLKGVRPDGYTMVGLITGILDSSWMKLGETVHGFCIKCGLASDDHVGSVLVKMYSSFKKVDSAFRVFDGLVCPDIVSWSALITCFSHGGDHLKALNFFRELVGEGAHVDRVLVATVVATCANLANIQAGSEIHGFAIRRGFSTEVVVSSTLVDMYAKCGFLESATKVFHQMPKKNIVSYNTLIISLGLHGRALDAFRLFEKVLEAKLNPDETTFIGLLCACCHSGLVNKGREYFTRMRTEFGIEPKTEHYVYMVRLLGMDGKLKEAYEVVQLAPKPVDKGVWGVLLWCCDAQKDNVMAEAISKRLVEDGAKDCRHSVMVSKFFARAGRWEDVEMARSEYRGAKGKAPGLSWVHETNFEKFN